MAALAAMAGQGTTEKEIADMDRNRQRSRGWTNETTGGDGGRTPGENQRRALILANGRIVVENGKSKAENGKWISGK
jgi:hypothetical protein